jgi:hypothetical protein
MLLLRFVDDTHPALAELAHEAEVADEAVGTIALWRQGGLGSVVVDG